MADLIDRQAAINALMEILDRPKHAEFLYTDEICNALNNVPSAERLGFLERNADIIRAETLKGNEVKFKIGGRLFAIRELAQ